jgi:hypothetical protein
VATASCGDDDPPQTQDDAAAVAALADLDRITERVREQVLRTCDKWKHLDGPCDEAKLRSEALECWMKKGRPAYDVGLNVRVGRRSRDHMALRAQYLCLEKRRWRRLKRSFEF